MTRDLLPHVGKVGRVFPMVVDSIHSTLQFLKTHRNRTISKKCALSKFYCAFLLTQKLKNEFSNFNYQEIECPIDSYGDLSDSYQRILF